MRNNRKHLNAIRANHSARRYLIEAIAACETREEVHALVMVAAEIRDTLKAQRVAQSSADVHTVHNLVTFMTEAANA